MSDERVERAMDAMWEASGIESWRSDGTATITEHDLEPMVRAVLAALDEEPTLEDVVGTDQRFAVEYVGIVQRGDDDWVALVDDARTKKRVEGVGSTIAAAIRAAVANAKEQG